MSRRNYMRDYCNCGDSGKCVSCHIQKMTMARSAKRGTIPTNAELCEKLCIAVDALSKIATGTDHIIAKDLFGNDIDSVYPIKDIAQQALETINNPQ